MVPPGPPGSMGGPMGGVPPPSTFPLPPSSVPGGMPPQLNQAGGPPHPGMPPQPGMQRGMPPQPPPPVATAQPPLPADASQVPGPPTGMAGGITGRRQYPQMVNYKDKTCVF